LTWQEKISIINDTEKLKALKELYSLPMIESCIHFINNFVYTYDPRNKNEKITPFYLFKKQEEFIKWLWDRYKKLEDGAVDKCRDVGATWCFIAFSTWLLLFQKESAVGLYTYKATECDNAGNPATLFGKIELILNNIPLYFKKDIISKNMYILNEFNGANIAGSSGDNPFRGDRKSIIFQDECAFYEQADKIEGAMSEASNCKIYVSTHAGTDTVFYNKVTSGAIPVFIFEWYDNPKHNQEWFDKKKQKAEQEGTMHIFQREILRNALASIASVLIPSIWVNAAKKITQELPGKKIVSVDVADEGTDTNALFCFDGNMPIDIDEWSTDDPNVSARKAFFKAVEFGAEEIRYDCIGVGAGLKAGFNSIIEELRKDPKKNEKALKIKIIGWSAAGKVVRPDDNDYGEALSGDKTNNEIFENAKAQGYFKIRNEFLHTYYCMNNEKHDTNKVINFKYIVSHKLFNKFTNEISQPVQRLSARGKIIVDKKGKNSKSPNLADAYMIGRAELEFVGSIWD
jgi:phage terminase large subunit